MPRSVMSRLAVAAFVASLAGIACSDPETAKRQYLENGDRYAADGRLNEAIVEYRNAVQTDPRFGEARRQLAQAYEQAGNAQAAFREYVRAADLLPDDAGVQAKAAGYLLAARQFQDSRTRAELALKLDPTNVDALIIRANATAGLRDVPGAIREIEEALEVQVADGRAYTALGALRVVEGQQAEAETAFKKAIEITPTSVDARLALANFYWSRERPRDVEQALKEAHSLDPSHLLTNRMLGLFYLATGRAAEAEAPIKAFVANSDDRRSALLLADYYVRMQRHSDAIAILKPLAEETGTRGAATIRLARIERSQGRREQARQMLNELIEAEPRNVEALMLVSGWRLRDGDVTGALAGGRAAVAADPASAPAHFALSQALVADRQVDEAIKSLGEVLRINPRILPAQLILSRLQLASGNAAAALELASAARTAAPNNPDIRHALAQSLIAQGSFPQAEVEVRALLAGYPQFAASHNLSGRLQMARGDTQGARAAYVRALERDPDSLEALEGLLAADVASSNVSAALSRVDARLAEDPNNAPLMFLAARTYAAAGQLDRAETALRSVVQRDPGNLNAYLTLGRIYASQGRLDNALAEYEAVARKQPNQVGAATMAAMILQAQNKTDQARRRYEDILNIDPRAPVAANNLAYLDAEAGQNLNVALNRAQLAAAALPDHPDVNDTLGWVYYKQNLASLAIPPLERSVQLGPANPTYRYHLGMAYLRAGDTVKGREALEQALKLDPKLADARAALASVEGTR